MMWKMHKVVFRLLTPLHVGDVKLGNVQRARHYVTGKALWGALTARLTRDCPELNGDYVAVGNRVNDQLAFSYFYPAVNEKVDPFPWDNADEFAWRYLNTYASTALDYGRNSAEEGSLHETEFIAPRTRDGAAVNLVGYIFEREGCTLKWQAALDRLQLGGKRTYGWGRVKRDSGPESAQSFWDGWTVDLDQPRPVLRTNGTAPVLYAHTITTAESDAMGRVEPLVGRETRAADAHGREFPRAQICWMPGARMRAAVPAQIDGDGVWKLV